MFVWELPGRRQFQNWVVIGLDKWHFAYKAPGHFLNKCWTVISKTQYSVNSLAPGRCDIELLIFKFISKIDVFGISCEIAHR